jgi:hypothetical protein
MNCPISGIYTCPTGTNIRFYLRAYTEEGYDYFNIRNSAGTTYAELNGDYGTSYFWTDTYSQRTAAFNFASDEGTFYWGVDLYRIECLTVTTTTTTTTTRLTTTTTRSTTTTTIPASSCSVGQGYTFSSVGSYTASSASGVPSISRSGQYTFYETQHNYANNLNCPWSGTYTCPAGTNIKFYLRAQSEATWDYIGIRNSGGTVYEQISGDNGAAYAWTGTYSERTASFNFVSDELLADWGVDLYKIECATATITTTTTTNRLSTTTTRSTTTTIGGQCYGAEDCNPTGNPIGGGPGYNRIISSGSVTVTNKAQLISALSSASSGTVIFIPGTVTIDMTGTPNTVIRAGVTLASDRGLGGSQGALIKYSSNSNGQYMTSIFVVGGNNVRVTGLRLEGENLPQDGTGNGESSFLVGIKSMKEYRGAVWGGYSGLEVDNCELRGFAWATVTTLEATNVYVHHNYIHHNQARGEGYGFDIYGGQALIEANIFDYNRHDIAAGGNVRETYEARYNIIGPNGHPIGSHHFDVHACNPNDLDDDSEVGPDFIAGDLYKIHHNTFQGGPQASVGIRSRPVTGAYINNNIFNDVIGDTEGGVPIFQRAYTFGNMFVTNNYWEGVLYSGDSIVWYYHP